MIPDILPLLHIGISSRYVTYLSRGEQWTKINAWNLISLARLIYIQDIEFELHFKPCVNLFPTQSKRECIWLCLLLGVESLQEIFWY